MDQYADDGSPIADDTQAGPTVYNPRLVQLRSNHLKELSDPRLRSFATRALLHEGGLKGLASNFEQLSNYANARGMGLNQALNSGFYGPVNNNLIQSSLSPQEAAAGDQAIQSVFQQGRNKIGYRIDQGMTGDRNYALEASDPKYRMASIDGTHFADHPEVGVGWAQQQLAADKAAGIDPTGQFEADGSPVAAINNAAGIKTPVGRGALAFSGDAADGGDENTGALSKANGDGALFKGEGKNKLHSLGSMLTNVAAALASINNPAQAQALQKQAEGIEAKAGSNYQYMMGANGQLVRINKNDGSVDSREIPNAQKGNFMPVMGKDQYNRPVPIGTFDRDSGKFTPFDKGGPASSGPMIGGDPELTGQERMDSMSKPDQIGVQAIIDGRDPRVLSSMSLRNNPELKARLEAAQAVEPGLDLNKVKARAVYWADQAKASPSSWGGIMRRSGIALDQLDKTIDNLGKLKNTDSALGPMASAIENRMVFGKASTERQAIIDELATNAQNASTDINSLQQGQHGTGAERDSIKGGLFKPNEAPSIQGAAAQAHLDALKSVVQRAKDAEAQNVGPGFIEKDARFKEYDALLKKAQDKLDKLKKGDFSYVGGATPAAAPPAAKAAALPQSWDDAQKSGWK